MRLLRPLASSRVFLVTCVLAATACSTMRTPAANSPAPSKICFVALSADSTALAGIEVALVSSSGRTPVGTTDGYGALCLDRQRVDATSAVLFCLEWFTCAAVRPDIDLPQNAEEFTVTLAPVIAR